VREVIVVRWWAQEAGAMITPGSGHECLGPMVGLWDTTTTRHAAGEEHPVEADGSVEKTWVLGGRFIREDLAGVGEDGQPHMGLGFIGYDGVRRVYQSVWMSSTTTAMSTSTGTIDESGTEITLVGEESDRIGGPPRRFTAVIRIESKDRHTITQSFVDRRGVLTPAFEIIYTRAITDR